jgi:hypothetical protein
MDDEDESERGWELVTSAAGWWTEMAKWIGEQQEVDDLDDDLEDAVRATLLTQGEDST